MKNSPITKPGFLEPKLKEKTVMVEMDFVRWTGENEFYRNKGKNGQWIFKVEPYIVWKTDNELYQYWFDNIKKK
jgi:hypothetical protein